MGCTFDWLKVKVKKQEHAKKFAELWNKVLGEGDYLYRFNEDRDLFEEFFEKNGSYVLNLDEDSLFSYYDDGNQNHLMIMSFIEVVPDAELEAEYRCEFSNCGDELNVAYHYIGGKLTIQEAYKEAGSGPEIECECCGEFLDEALVDSLLESQADTFICPECGEESKFFYEEDVITENTYLLEFFEGKWKYPDGFSFRPRIEAEDASRIEERAEVAEVPTYILDKANAKKSGMAKIMIAQSAIKTLMNAELQPESTNRLKMTIDYIDLPIKVVAIPEETSGNIEFNVYLRQVWDDDSVSADGIITWNPSSGSVENAIADNDIAELFKNIIVVTYNSLILYLSTTDEFKEYDTTDLDLENLLVYTEDDSIMSRIVYGTSRPDLLANGLMGSLVYVRPCAQEEMKMEVAAKKYN